MRDIDDRSILDDPSFLTYEEESQKIVIETEDEESDSGRYSVTLKLSLADYPLIVLEEQLFVLVIGTNEELAASESETSEEDEVIQSSDP